MGAVGRRTTRTFVGWLVVFGLLAVVLVILIAVAVCLLATIHILGGTFVVHCGRTAMLTTVLIVILILMLVGAFPAWPHASSWGYGPSGVLAVVLVILLILMLMGRI